MTNNDKATQKNSGTNKTHLVPLEIGHREVLKLLLFHPYYKINPENEGASECKCIKLLKKLKIFNAYKYIINKASNIKKCNNLYKLIIWICLAIIITFTIKHFLHYSLCSCNHYSSAMGFMATLLAITIFITTLVYTMNLFTPSAEFIKHNIVTQATLYTICQFLMVPLCFFLSSSSISPSSLNYMIIFTIIFNILTDIHIFFHIFTLFISKK